MNIYIAADHAGFELKEKLKKVLAKRYNLIDLTPVFLDGDDYPDVAEKVAKKVGVEKNSRGILVCGSSTGVCIAANKIKGVRAVQGFNEAIAQFAREREDANVLCLSGCGVHYAKERKKLRGAMTTPKALKIVDAWLKAKFVGLARDKRRIEKITALEKR